ncbi:MAG: HigA family addiction module antitoxin [Actinomycetota bacterium]|nr:HigA family addiction module antitoxin [Actinomycetota bacterium]
MGDWTEEIEREPRIYPPIHPGELLKEEFLDPMGITVYRLAKDIGVDRMRVHEIVHGKRRVSPDTALRLSRYFGMSDGYWINAQSHYDLETAKMESGERIAREVMPLERA